MATHFGCRLVGEQGRRSGQCSSLCRTRRCEGHGVGLSTLQTACPLTRCAAHASGANCFCFQTTGEAAVCGRFGSCRVRTRGPPQDSRLQSQHRRLNQLSRAKPSRALIALRGARQRADEPGVASATANAADTPRRAFALFAARLRVAGLGLHADTAPARFLRAEAANRAPAASTVTGVGVARLRDTGVVDANLSGGATAALLAGLSGGVPSTQPEQGSEHPCGQRPQHDSPRRARPGLRQGIEPFRIHGLSP
jgi:hypothetical protein